MPLVWCVVLALGAGASCQRILGIHGNTNDAAVDAPPSRDAGAETGAMIDAPQRPDGAEDGPPPDHTSDGSTSDAGDGPRPGEDASGGQDGPLAADGGGDREDDDGGVMNAPDAAGDGAAAPDAAATDGPPPDRSGDAAPSDGAGADAAACAPAWHAENVEARLFTLTSTSMTACSVPAAAVPARAAAIDAANFRGAQACGACLRVQAASGTTAVTVPVVERSEVAGLLLTRAAMDQISPGGSLIRVDWRLVPCDTGDQPLRYYIKEGSNSGYVGVQVRNARYPIMSVAAVGTGRSSLPLTLQPYNYWESTAAGGGPLTLRITDINGQVLEDSGIRVLAQTETVGQGQFPVCR